MTKLTKYLIFTFAVPWIIMIIGYNAFNSGTASGDSLYNNSLALCMFIPTIGAFIVKANIKGMGWNPKIEKNWKFLLIAWLAPTVLQILGAICYYIVFPDDLDTSGGFLKEYDPDEFERFKECGSSFVKYYAKEILNSLMACDLMISTVLGLGEEIGWRGFMYPELKERFGYTKGVLLGGVIHGAWHFPVMLLMGYEYGKDYIGAPLLGLFAFCVYTTATGVIYSFLYEKSHCILVCAIYHASINAAFNPKYLGRTELRRVFGPADIGLVAVIPTVLVAAAIIYFRNKNSKMEFDEL